MTFNWRTNILTYWAGGGLLSLLCLGIMWTVPGVADTYRLDSPATWTFIGLMSLLFGTLMWCMLPTHPPSKQPRTMLALYLKRFGVLIWWAVVTAALWALPVHGSDGAKLSDLPIIAFIAFWIVATPWAFLSMKDMRAKEVAVGDDRVRLAKRLEEQLLRLAKVIEANPIDPRFQDMLEGPMFVLDLLIQQDGYWPDTFIQYSRGRLTENARWITSMSKTTEVPDILLAVNATVLALATLKVGEMHDEIESAMAKIGRAS